MSHDISDAEWNEGIKALGAAFKREQQGSFDEPPGSARVPDCDFCSRPQVFLGAVAFGPPDNAGKCEKRHICRACWARLTVAPD